MRRSPGQFDEDGPICASRFDLSGVCHPQIAIQRQASNRQGASLQHVASTKSVTGTMKFHRGDSQNSGSGGRVSATGEPSQPALIIEIKGRTEEAVNA
jgi:hypothetical protein